MNFSGIAQSSLLGTILRLPLRLIPANAIVPILQGPMKGKKWIAGSEHHGCWLGSYEFEKQKMFCKYISAGTVVYDIGANVGFYTLLSSVLAGTAGTVVAFEPLPRNIELLKKHITINNCSNVTITEAAVTNISGTVSFKEGPTFTRGSITNKGDLDVTAVSLDTLVDSGKIPAPDVIKMDIEGGEYLALLGAEKLLKEKKPILFLATHGKEVNEQCVDFLQNLQYSITPLDASDIHSASELLVYDPQKYKAE